MHKHHQLWVHFFMEEYNLKKLLLRIKLFFYRFKKKKKKDYGDDIYPMW